MPRHVDAKPLGFHDDPAHALHLVEQRGHALLDRVALELHAAVGLNFNSVLRAEEDEVNMLDGLVLLT